MNKMAQILLLLMFLFLSGCSDSEDKTTEKRSGNEHVWKAQTRAIEKANDVDQILQNAEKQRRAIIDDR